MTIFAVVVSEPTPIRQAVSIAAIGFLLLLDLSFTEKSYGMDRPAVGALLVAQNAVSEPAEEKAWTEARRNNTEVSYIRFLELFPAGRYAAEARAALEKFDQAQTMAPTLPTSPATGISSERSAPSLAIKPNLTFPQPAPTTSPSVFSWDYQQASGKMTVNSEGGTKECLVADPAQLTGVGVYRANGELRVNFEKKQNSANQAHDVTLEEFCSPGQGVARLRATPVVDRSPALMSLSTVELCRNALTGSKEGWDLTPAFASHVVEAKVRGITVDGCQKALRVAPVSPSPSNSRPDAQVEPKQPRGCIVADPTGTPLNIRTSPNGAIVATLGNGSNVRILQSSSSNGKPWALISRTTGQRLGWVFRAYLRC